MDDAFLPFALPDLPALLAGETLYSWCGYVHLWAGNATALATSKQLFGAPYAALHHDFPSYINELVRRVPGQLGPARSLALERTLLGYFLPFANPETATAVLDAVCRGAYPQIKWKLGVLASRAGAQHPLKRCPACAAEDRARYGRAFWHVVHQYPSVVACAEHRAPLQIALIDKTPIRYRAWLLPDYGPSPRWYAAQLGEPTQLTLALKLAEYSAFSAKVAPASFRPVVLARTYQGRLKDLGMLTPGGSLRLPALTRMVRDCYAGFEQLPGFRVLESVRPDWAGLVGSLMRKHPRPGHPIKHLLLIALLFERWPDFMVAYMDSAHGDQSKPSEPEPKHERPPDPRIARFLALIRQDGLGVRQAAARVGVTSTTGTAWAKRHAVSYTARTKTLHPGRLEGARQLLRQGATKAKVTLETGISGVSLTRLLSTEPQLRAAWQAARDNAARARNRLRFLKIVHDHPGVSVHLLRRIPGNGYQWLYRHDRQWLVDHLPSFWNGSRAENDD